MRGQMAHGGQWVTRYYCVNCKGWLPAFRGPEEGESGDYICEGCGDVILCDECGKPWSDDHHHARPDDDPEPGDRCKDCGKDITWLGPSHYDWIHTDEQEEL